MTNKELIEKIDEVLEEIHPENKIGHGLCWHFSYNYEIIVAMKNFAQSQGLCTTGYWWEGDANCVESWYAPRKAFLEQWRTDLLEET